METRTKRLEAQLREERERHATVKAAYLALLKQHWRTYLEGALESKDIKCIIHDNRDGTEHVFKAVAGEVGLHDVDLSYSSKGRSVDSIDVCLLSLDGYSLMMRFKLPKEVGVLKI